MSPVAEKIINQPICGLNVRKIHKNERLEVLSISLERDAIFPEHTSPEDALLLVLEGSLEFHISGETHRMGAYQQLAFGQHVPHHVVAVTDTRFLIIR